MVTRRPRLQRIARTPGARLHEAATETVLRKLAASERPLLTAHLLRLDADDRTRRFMGTVDTHHVERYCGADDGRPRLVIGFFVDRVLRGAAELVLAAGGRPGHAEIALSVERPWQNQGVGAELLRRAVILARNRGAAPLRLYCLRENRRMLAIARKAGATLSFEGGEVEGTIVPAWPNTFSLLAETWSDGHAAFRIGCASLRRPVAVRS